MNVQKYLAESTEIIGRGQPNEGWGYTTEDAGELYLGFSDQKRLYRVYLGPEAPQGSEEIEVEDRVWFRDGGSSVWKTSEGFYLNPVNGRNPAWVHSSSRLDEVDSEMVNIHSVLSLYSSEVLEPDNEHEYSQIITDN